LGKGSVREKALKIEKCVQGGAGLTRLPSGSVCFVDGALPGETVEIKITEQKRDFAKASAIRILEPHSKRRDPPCPYYGKCGGCNAQHAEFDLQIELLKQITLDLFSRIAKINLPQDFEMHHGSEWGYRYRAKLKNNGFQMRGSNEVIPIEKCMVLTEKLNEELKTAKKTYLFDNQSEKFLGKHIYADESVFFQSNLELLPKLMQEVSEAVGEGNLLFDIFCGVGLFSAFLQDKFERVIAIEQNPLCQKFAEKNLGKNCEFYAMDAEEWGDFSGCILIDPPRAGITDKLCDNLRGDKIIYVSCNPATLARDTRKLLDKGYKLTDIKGFAFYPQTFHLEMLAKFN